MAGAAAADSLQLGLGRPGAARPSDAPFDRRAWHGQDARGPLHCGWGTGPQRSSADGFSNGLALFLRKKKLWNFHHYSLSASSAKWAWCESCVGANHPVLALWRKEISSSCPRPCRTHAAAVLFHGILLLSFRNRAGIFWTSASTVSLALPAGTGDGPALRGRA